MIRLFGLALLCTVSSLLLRGERKEWGILLGASGVLLLLTEVLPLLNEPLAQVRQWMEKGGIGEGAASVGKAVGICLCTEFGAQFCRDAGEGGIAKALEWAGRILILVLSFPLLGELVSLTEEMLG